MLRGPVLNEQFTVLQADPPTTPKPSIAQIKKWNDDANNPAVAMFLGVAGIDALRLKVAQNIQVIEQHLDVMIKNTLPTAQIGVGNVNQIPPELVEEINGLIGQLGDKNFKVRASAYVTLVEKLKTNLQHYPVGVLIETAGLSADEQIRTSAQKILNLLPFKGFSSDNNPLGWQWELDLIKTVSAPARALDLLSDIAFNTGFTTPVRVKALEYWSDVFTNSLLP